MIRGAIGKGTERSFCTSNRDGNASENSSSETMACGDLKICTARRAVPSSDNEFYCPTMTRERFSLIYRSHGVALLTLLQISVQIFSCMCLRNEQERMHKQKAVHRTLICIVELITWQCTFIH